MKVLESYKGGKIALVEIEDATFQPYVMVRNLNVEENCWGHGSYFSEYDDAKKKYDREVRYDAYQACETDEEKREFILRDMENQVEKQRKLCATENYTVGLLCLGQLVYVQDTVEDCLGMVDKVNGSLWDLFEDPDCLTTLIHRVNDAYQQLDDRIIDETGMA